MKMIVLAVAMMVLSGCAGGAGDATNGAESCEAYCNDQLVKLGESCPRCFPIYDPVICPDGRCACSGPESCP